MRCTMQPRHYTLNNEHITGATNGGGFQFQNSVLDTFIQILVCMPMGEKEVGGEQCIIHSIRCTLHTTHCTLNDAHHTLATVYDTLHTRLDVLIKHSFSMKA